VCKLIETKANSDDTLKILDEVKRSVELLNSKLQSLESSKHFSEMHK
jgi:hypothetical protein